MKALVTGATGFIGSRLTRELLQREHRVGILTRATSDRSQISDLLPRLDMHLVDEQPQSVRRALAAASPDIVFHLATFFARDPTEADVEEMLMANIAFPLRIIDAMQREGIQRLVNTGSAWQYFECSDYRPVCLHSATKQALTDLIEYYVQGGALDCVTLVMHDSYGPGDPRSKLFGLLRESSWRPEPLLMSGGEQLMDLIHVDDAVTAYMAAAELLLQTDRAPQHQVFSVSGGAPLPLRRVVEMYLGYAGISVPIRWGAREYHKREVMRPWTGGLPVPGWRPRVKLEAGLRQLALSVGTQSPPVCI